MRTDLAYQKGRQVIKKERWELLRKVCQTNKSGRKILISDAIREGVDMWIESNKI